jgi:methyltransferase (TIGR00027 family)
MKPISRTAFYTAGIRMLDTKVKRPICNDTYAHVFMNEAGIEILNNTRNILGARITTVQRHQIIDEVLKKFIQQNNATRIFIIGAGFDTRAYRLNGGIWTEVDEPEIITYKEEKLPASESPNSLTRIMIDFANEKLYNKLIAYKTDEKVVVVVEGVTMYLSERLISELLLTLENLFSNHSLVCDLLTKPFFNRFSKKLHKQLSGLGAAFQFHHDDPHDFFLEHGYTQKEKISVVETAINLGNIKIPRIAMFLFKKTLITGYTINVFEKQKTA